MTVRIITADCREALATLPAESVHCCISSPPYWGLRDYGTAKWEGGDPACDHVERQARNDQNAGRPTAGPDRGGSFRGGDIKFKQTCPCGARRVDSQIGLESTYQDFVEQMVAVFREVRRVLRKDGTCWVNLGDTYNNADKWGGGGVNTGKHTKSPDGSIPSWAGVRRKWAAMDGLKPKDLCGIPWRVAFALQADGWWLRQDIIWSKPNPMPESVTDRCTKAHEYLFLLSKSERYYFDAKAIAEPSIHAGDVKDYTGNQKNNSVDPEMQRTRLKGRAITVPDTRNKRSVWEVATQPFSEAHFATFPPALIEPCILAGCPKGGTVLDPFGGAGTTGLVADRLQRDAILIELNPAYADMARKRISGDSPLFAEMTAP